MFLKKRPESRHTGRSPNRQQLLCSPGGGLIARRSLDTAALKKGRMLSEARPYPLRGARMRFAGNTQDFWQNLPGAAKVKSFDFEGAFGHTRSEASPNDVYR